MGRTNVITDSYPILFLLITSNFPCISFTLSMEGGDSAQEHLQGTYYTLHQDHSHVTLNVNPDGEIGWDLGIPTLYSVFQEKLVHTRMEGGAQNRTYTLEAVVTRCWICMNGKGHLYPVHRLKFQLERRELRRRFERARVRHETMKRSRPRWRRGPPSPVPPPKLEPPPDCLFSTFEFDPKDSYEKSVGIYSSVHSNKTHGRFLSISPQGEVRTYRKPFWRVHHHHHLKITQVPIRYLGDMVEATRFGRGEEYNEVVRKCINVLCRCPSQKSLRKVIGRCRRRAERTDRLPKCSRRDAPPEMMVSGGGGGGGKRRNKRGRKKRRKNQVFGET